MDEPTRAERMPDKQHPDEREAWVLRAGAELWRAVVAEADCPAEDTQIALRAVRFALDCARRFRFAGDVAEPERAVLAEEADHAAEVQAQALQRWGEGRGYRWSADWGTQWGEALSSEDSRPPDPTEKVTRLRHPL